MYKDENKNTNDQYRELFERSADAILILEGDKFTDCNQATVNMLGYATREELLQTHPSQLSPEFQPDGASSFDKANKMIAIALAEGSHRFEWSHLRIDGTEFPVEVLLTAMPLGGRKVLHTTWRDITERKRLEAELRQAQKMEAIGRLTGAIAHDFNNLLVAILGHAELLEMSLDHQPDLMEHVTQISRAGDRAASLVKQLLAFSHKQVMQPKVLNINRVFAEMEQMLNRLLGENIQIKARFTDTPLWVKMDPGQLEQVIVNLTTNARDAMPEGGTLSFVTSLVEISQTNSGSNENLAAGCYASFCVGDTGSGIGSATVANIFEPFFTTKESGKGTGLGLSTVYGITKRIGGDVAVQTEEGKGSIFQIYLPISNEAPPVEKADLKSAEPSPLGAEIILLVEDDPSVAGLIKMVLRGAGYTVHYAENGQEALDLIAHQELEFDLLLTDVAMPLMGGPELVSQLRVNLPLLKVLYISGYTSSSLTDFGNLREGVNLIHKPFSSQDLLSRLRLMLDENEANDQN